jgi:hypothetical protein
MPMCMHDMERVQAMSLHDECLVRFVSMFMLECMDLMHCEAS